MKSFPWRGTDHFCLETRAIIDMGGEDAKLILVDQEEGHLVIQDFARNTMCAAGIAAIRLSSGPSSS